MIVAPLPDDAEVQRLRDLSVDYIREAERLEMERMTARESSEEISAALDEVARDYFARALQSKARVGGGPGGGDAGWNRVRYRYRLLLHVIAARVDYWSRNSTDPANRRNERAVTVANVRFCDRAPKNGRRSGALIPEQGSSPPRITTQGRVCCDFV